MSRETLEYIASRKKELNAIILAHYYQNPDIQDTADFVGDSLQLAEQAAQTDADVIVTCGVSFMAESAKILSPNKKVLLPDIEAGCPMADMVTAEALRKKKAEHPNAVVVCYVNTSAEVKAECDICCTSSNAEAVIKSIPEDKEILFVPDRNLGQYIQDQTGRKMTFWEGYCPIHDVLTINEVEEQKALHPNAKVVVHPECPPEVTRNADVVKSTSGILNYIKESEEKEFIVGTEEGFLYTVQKACPDKKIYLARAEFTCNEMKHITLEKLARTLETMEHEIEVPENIRQKAVKSLDRMLAIAP
ncbi:Quinolinate synthetase [Candidatus Syntrophocurvum alkaliphilum]|uniref:Quinolinate synthase n=1 Tax=Candidatus Syntrophocurvum alkaliphilum TaxID=2293317 RepID=A0A6I6DEH8_9FIRM|nr:quinolinate synthase NadA [Candidatus Syntrophocurvum alkaliphilum]QGU00506.1 Quinolinate synthetase [Candidatus Syntrophocurvum alkaliphilum]